MPHDELFQRIIGLARSYHKKNGNSNRRDLSLFPTFRGLSHDGCRPRVSFSQLADYGMRATTALVLLQNKFVAPMFILA